VELCACTLVTCIPVFHIQQWSYVCPTFTSQVSRARRKERANRLQADYDQLWARYQEVESMFESALAHTVALEAQVQRQACRTHDFVQTMAWLCALGRFGRFGLGRAPRRNL
jgi:hypothetical protein